MSTTDRTARPAGQSGRVGPETLPALTSPDRIAAVVGMGGMPDGRAHELLAVADKARRDAAQPEGALPAVMPPRTGVPVRLLAVAAAALMVTAFAWVFGGDPAHAAVAPRPAGVTLTLAGPTVAVRVPVPGATVAAWMQTTTGAVRLSVRRGFAVAVLPSVLVRPGESVIELDQIGASVVRIPVTARRQSRVSAPMPTAWGGSMLVQGVVSHYDPATGGYRGDVASPVQVQVLPLDGAGRWVTVATLTTDPTGAVVGLVPPMPGMVRLIRPVGATVTGGTGIAVFAQGGPCLSARGDLIYC